MDVKTLAKKHEAYIIEQRRWFHAHPELAFNEHETTAHIAAELEKAGIEVRTLSHMTGVIGTLRGGLASDEKPGKTVLLRADMDALPGAEETGLPFASVNGNMHACGHDSHMAVALGAARILSDMRDEIAGTVRFVFEPAEESFEGRPEIKGGIPPAVAPYGSWNMVQAGVTDGVDAVFALHVWGGLDSGKISVEPGVRMAAKNSFSIKVHGLTSHGAAPQFGHDAVVAASAIVMNLQTLVSRSADPRDMVALTIGQLTAGSAPNSVADEAVMHGTARTFARDFRPSIHPLMERIIHNTAQSLGCTAELDYKNDSDVIDNDDEGPNNAARAAAEEAFGAGNIVTMPPVTASESFADYMERVPAHFAFVGARTDDMVYSNHNSRFSADESVLKNAAAYLSLCAVKFMEQ